MIFFVFNVDALENNIYRYVWRCKLQLDNEL